MTAKGNPTRAVLVGALAFWPGYALWSVLAAIWLIVAAALHAAGDVPDWMFGVMVGMLVVLQVLAVAGAVALYWAPRLRNLTLDDGSPQQPAPLRILVILAAWPVLVMLGIARGAEDAPGWVYLLGGACLIVVGPAILDQLVRQSLGTDRKVRGG